MNGSPTPEEAAAISAAVAQFERDTASPPVEEDATAVSPWVRAARLDSVDRDPGRAFWI